VVVMGVGEVVDVDMILKFCLSDHLMFNGSRVGRVVPDWVVHG